MTRYFYLNFIGLIIYGITTIITVVREEKIWTIAFLSGFIIFLINIVTNKMMKK